MPAEKLPYDHSPVVDRDFDLPDGNNVAVWVVINIEHDRVDEPVSTSIYEGTSTYTPDVFNYGWREYGLRVGVWRMLDRFDEHDIPVTVALNGEVCDHEPEIVEAMDERGWEFMGHGMANSERLAGLDEDEERAVIRATRDRIEAATDTPPRGWIGPGLTETFNTPRLLADEGFEYVADWANDDQPYPMHVPTGDLVAVPYSVALNDVTLLVKQGMTPRQYEQALKDEFDVLYEEGAEAGSGKVMAIALHPYLVGQPFCSKYLDRVLDYISRHRDVWMTTGGEIARHYDENYQ